MHTNQKMAQSMAKTTTTMSKINKQMDVKKMAKTMQNFEKENMKMEMTEEMMNDAMGKFFETIRSLHVILLEISPNYIGHFYE